jgi:hypothetical protein
MTEVRKAVLRFTRRQVGKALFGMLAALGVEALPYTADALGLLRHGRGRPTPPGAITTFMLVNGRRSTQPRGVATQTFGMPFKDGDMPAGSAPVFTVGGAAQPFSYGLRSYYPSGNLKFVSIMLLPTFGLGASGSVTVTVSARVGSWPSSSGRSTTDIYNQQLVVNAPPLATPDPSGLASNSGAVAPIGTIPGNGVQVGAWLRSDSNNYRVVAWMDGAAGAAWRISTNMAPTIGGTPDTFLKFDHYIFALNNSSGGLAGFRWFGRIRMPNYSVMTTANNNFFCAPPNSGTPTAGLNWQINPGGAGLQTFVPVWPFVTATDFTADPTNNLFSTTQGATWATGSQNLVPVQLSGGSVPAPFVAGQVWWGQVNNGAGVTDNVGLFGSAELTTDTRRSIAGTGTCTATPVFGFTPFTSVGFATVDAKYNYFQGTGSQAAETTLRMQINQTYWQSSKLIPPYDLTLSGSAQGGPIADTTYPFNWNPFCIATISSNINQGGDSEFIGALKSIDIVDFYNQSALSEKQIRIAGLAAALMPFDLKDPTLDTVVNVSSNTYTGLPASNLTIAWGGRGGTPANGFTSPGPDGLAGPLGFGASDASHVPFFAYWPYLRTGELQYFDFLADLAIGAELGQPNRNPRAANGDSPYDADGCLTYGVQQYRGMGWGLRNLQAAALVAPWNPTAPTAPDFDGTQRGKYLNDLADLSANFLIDQWTANPGGIFPAYAQSASLWASFNYNAYSGKPAYGQGPFWEQCYIGLGACYAVARGNAKAISFLELLGARATYVGQTYGFYPLYAYNQAFTFDSAVTTYNLGLKLITGDPLFVISQISAINATLSWTPNAGGTTNAFSLSQAPNNGYMPQNGDVIIPTDINGVFRPTELSTQVPYYIVGYNAAPRNGAYATFNLSTAKRGAPVAIASVPGARETMVVNYMPSRPGPQDTVPYAANFMYQVQECAKWGQALGATGWGTTIADVNHRNTHGIGFGPNWHFKSGDGYNPVDARYCVQAFFA